MSDVENEFLNAVSQDDIETVAGLLDAHPELAADPHYMLTTVQIGSADAVCLMIEHGAPVAINLDDGFPLLHLALDRQRDQLPGKPPRDHAVLTLLLQAGADVNERGINDWSARCRAAAIGDLEACRILLAQGADRTLRTRIDDNATPEEEARILGQHAAADIIRDFDAAL